MKRICATIVVLVLLTYFTVMVNAEMEFLVELIVYENDSVALADVSVLNTSYVIGTSDMSPSDPDAFVVQLVSLSGELLFTDYFVALLYDPVAGITISTNN